MRGGIRVIPDSRRVRAPIDSGCATRGRESSAQRAASRPAGRRMTRPLAAMALLVAVAGCRAEHVEGPPEAITIAIAAIPHTSLVQLAVAEGFFAREGLAVTLQPYEFGKQALSAMTMGKADLATCAETPLVFAALHADRIAVLATIANSTRATAVVARKQSGITTAK